MAYVSLDRFAHGVAGIADVLDVVAGATDHVEQAFAKTKLWMRIANDTLIPLPAGNKACREKSLDLETADLARIFHPPPHGSTPPRDIPQGKPTSLRGL